MRGVSSSQSEVMHRQDDPAYRRSSKTQCKVVGDCGTGGDFLHEVEVNLVKTESLVLLKFFVLLCLVFGGAGLILASMISTRYMDTLPRWPDQEEMRYIPRNINGTVVYQTKQEDRRLTAIEDGSAGLLVIGLGLGLVYLERWSATRARAAEEDEAADDAG